MLQTPRIPLLGALACFAGLLVTGLLAYLVPLARVRDAATLQGFTALNRPRLTPFIDQVAHLADPGPYALIGFSLAGVALLRRRPRVAAAIVVLLVVTGATTMALKPLLASPRYDDWLGSGQIGPASWPSGHATAAMTLALCAILAVPARARPTVAAVGAVFSISVSYAILALGWHFPSDVLGGFFVATTWTALAVAGLVRLEQHRPPGLGHAISWRPADALAPLMVGCVVTTVAGAVVLARPAAVARFVADHGTFMAGAAAIAALAVALVLGLARGVRAS
jgi:membrane-associated phospholipid phosphatase